MILAETTTTTTNWTARVAALLKLLEEDLRQRQAVLDAVRHILQDKPTTTATGASVPTADELVTAVRLTVADAAERVLAHEESLHLKELAAEIERRCGLQVTPKNLRNTLARWVGRKQRFTRVGPNRFALRR